MAREEGAGARLTVVLVSPRNPLNIGAVARAMSNFGCFDLRLVDAYRVAADEARAATHAGIVLEKSRDFATLADAVADCSLVVGTASLGPRDTRHELLRLEKAASRIQAFEGRVALVFGSEKSGMTNEDMSRCHFLLTIPSDLEHGSMNLGQAVAVCLYELARGREVPELDNRRPNASAVEAASAEAQERIASLLYDALDVSGYVNERTASSMRMKIQRLILRTPMSRKDAEIWQGMARQILWKLRGNPKT